MRHSLLTWITGLALVGTALSSCDKKSDADPSIANIAVANADFSVLEDAAVRGGVVEVLSNKNPNDPQGNYTVFAPNNAAFARLGLNSAADLTALQKPFLTNTLLYHVSGGNLTGAELRPGLASASALSGITRRILERNGVRYINGSRILATDVRASNGTVHVIDKVLLATGANIAQSAIALQTGQVFVKPELRFLVAAVVHAGLVNDLSGTTQLTVFAPTDQAFIEFGRLNGLPLNEPADITALPAATVRGILLNHVIVGSRFTPELPENASVNSLGNTPVRFGAFDNGVLPVRGAGSTGANMLIPDVQCTNGVVHVIDRVL